MLKWHTLECHILIRVTVNRYFLNANYMSGVVPGTGVHGADIFFVGETDYTETKNKYDTWKITE